MKVMKDMKASWGIPGVFMFFMFFFFMVHS
jgi:hypothetical protein